VPQSYGVAADTLGRIWNTQWNFQEVSRISADGNTIAHFGYLSNSTRGVVVTPVDNNAWAANSGLDSITRIASSGAQSANIVTVTQPVGLSPTGVAVDSKGYVWATYRASDNVKRIDPTSNAPNLDVPLGVGARPYNYSDMTGVNLYHTIAPAGVLAIVHPAQAATVHWRLAWWQENVAHEGSVSLAVRAAEVITELGSKPYVTVEKNQDFLCKLVKGRYLQTRFQLNASSHASVWPVLLDANVSGGFASNVPDCNGNGEPDECEIPCGARDCNDNGIPDECDIASGAPDCNGDGVPNECEPDCDQDGTPDGCEIASGESCDADGNDIPDECFACCSGQQCNNTTQALCQSPAVFWEDLMCSDCGGGDACETLQCCVGSTCSEMSRCQCLTQGARHGCVGVVHGELVRKEYRGVKGEGAERTSRVGLGNARERRAREGRAAIES